MYAESRQPVFKDVGPKEAEAFLALNNFPGQRKFNPSKGKNYADNMADGRHRRVEIAIAKVRSTKTDYLMNGQHNCRGIMLYGKHYPAVVSYYSCDSMEDAWRLFATFDVHASRTEQQFMHARRGLFKDERLHDIPLRVLQSCGTALYALGNGTDPLFGMKSNAKTEKADLVERNPGEVLFVSQYTEFPHVMLTPAVTAVIATYRKNAKAAQEFWDKVGTGEMLSLADPRRRLRDALMSGSHLTNTKGGGSSMRASYIACILWWNSWRNGGNRKIIKVSTLKEIPKVSE
jgi:hypothetical protein